jgi:hypothetical protein
LRWDWIFFLSRADFVDFLDFVDFVLALDFVDFVDFVLALDFVDFLDFLVVDFVDFFFLVVDFLDFVLVVDDFFLVQEVFFIESRDFAFEGVFEFTHAPHLQVLARIIHATALDFISVTVFVLLSH